MSLRRYVPTGRGGPFAFTAVLGAAVIGGVVTGAIEGAVDQWFSLFVIFPLLIGLAAGGLAAWMVGRQQLRAPLLAMILAATGGAAGYVTVHTVDYLQLRSRVAAAVKEDHPAASELEISTATDAWLVSETGHAGFRGFLELAAREGVQVKRMSSTDNGISFTGTAAWIVWLCELVFAAAFAGFIARVRAKAPFCESCEVWYGPEQAFASGGTGGKPAQKEIMAALEAGDLDAAAGVLAAPPAPKATFAVTTTTCPRCTLDAHCILKRVTAARNKTRVATLDSWLMAREEVARLGEALAKRRSSAAAPARPG